MAMKKASARKGRERRGSERADARLSMRVEAGAIAGAPRIVTESQNISSSGVYCHASHYLAPLSKVQLTIILPRTPGGDARAQELLKCEAIVVRCDQRATSRSDTPYELACMVTALDPELQRRLEEFVTWRNLQALRAALAPAAGRRVSASARSNTKPTNKSASRSVRGATKPVAKKVAREGARNVAREGARNLVRASVRTGARPSAGRARG